MGDYFLIRKDAVMEIKEKLCFLGETVNSILHNIESGLHDAAILPADEIISRLENRVAEQEKELVRLRDIILKDEREIQQTLGKALGYPNVKDDKVNFPGATEDDYIVAPDTAMSLVDKAVERIERHNQRERDLIEKNIELLERVRTAESRLKDLTCELSSW